MLGGRSLAQHVCVHVAACPGDHDSSPALLLGPGLPPTPAWLLQTGPITCSSGGHGAAGGGGKSRVCSGSVEAPETPGCGWSPPCVGGSRRWADGASRWGGWGLPLLPECQELHPEPGTQPASGTPGAVCCRCCVLPGRPGAAPEERQRGLRCLGTTLGLAGLLPWVPVDSPRAPSPGSLRPVSGSSAFSERVSQGDLAAKGRAPQAQVSAGGCSFPGPGALPRRTGRGEVQE